MCSHTPVQPKKHTLCTRTPLQNTESNAGRERRAAHPLCPSSDSLLNFSMGGWNEWTSCTPRGKRSLESRVAHPPTATTDSVSPAAYLTSIRETHQFVLSVCFYAPSPLPFFPSLVLPLVRCDYLLKRNPIRVSFRFEHEKNLKPKK